MSKPKASGQPRQPHAREARHGIDRPKPATPPMSDRAVYWGVVIVGLFVVLLGWMLSEGSFWRQTAIGYFALVLLNINFAGWDLYGGKRLSDWKQSLAKIPLRSLGYGKKDGKPLEAAHDQPAVKSRMLAFGVLSVLLVVAIGFLLLWVL